MGIPKFFRFMSERYPLISNLIVENKIPEFDNLYLDMNGIIHNCSHPNDDDAHFRITEDQIFVAIFGYIEHLFTKIKPKKVFFMAIDGVAPRAKMNQQRSRRFRTAREAKEVRDRAIRKGEDLPQEAAFDSNAITPGTPFMARLSEQLKWFVNKKMTEDANWKGVEVILSGHEVPGEGEHKIMEYIRHAKAQPGYNPNVRHCLYGLDADLIMLGLLSHDPHFCLLREEVTFGPARKKQKSGQLEATNFFLLHLSLFREYLDLEFQCIELQGFEYDLERVIDDFILLAMLVGNDFLPHLPGLHIHEGALPLLFTIYKSMLPTAGGYLNEHGVLNLKRFQIVLDGLAFLENQQFEEEYADMNWFKGKQKKHIDAMEKARAKGKLVLTVGQRLLYDRVKAFVVQNTPTPAPNASLSLPATLPARDRRFLQTLASDLNLSCDFDEIDDTTQEPLIVLHFSEDVALDSEDDHDGAEAKMAVDRVIAKYDKAPTHTEPSESDFEEEYARKLEESHAQWKRDYYREKLEFSVDGESQLHDLVYRYIEGLQWVLHYYYDGVVSWGWFYDYHYAPKISDLKNIDSFQFSFALGQPFKPFEQLMGVLPDLSRAIIPEAYRDLLSDPASPIIDFYPRDFVQDLNGKKQDWEAVVKIPFIDEKRLLKTMSTRDHRLTPEEHRRNRFGESWRFTIGSANNAHHYPSSLPGFFPDLLQCLTVMEPYLLPTMDGLRFVKGLCEGVLLGRDAFAGFPSLNTLPVTGQLGYHSVKVFQQESKGETMVLTVDHPEEGASTASLAAKLINQAIYVNWPHLQEGLVCALSDELFRYEAGGAQVPHRPDVVANWRKVTERIDFDHSKRYAVVIGDVDVVVHVRLLKGLKRTEEGAFVKDYVEKEVDYALQTVVTNVSSIDERYIEREARPIEEEYPEDSNVFFLGGVSYGSPARVVGHERGFAALRYAMLPTDRQEQYLYRNLIAQRPSVPYHPSHVVSRKVKMSALTLSKITSSLMINVGGEQKINAGLNLKFEAKSQKVLGYTRKADAGWEYSDKAIDLIRDYKASFPEIIAALDASRKGDVTRAEDFFPNCPDLEQRIRELKAWIAKNGTRDFDKVALYSEQLEKETVVLIEQYADNLRENRRADLMQIVVVRNIPRRALLKPDDAEFRLTNQAFVLGDRVVQVQDTGNVPLCNKGVVVGIQDGGLDIVWDQPFIGGTTLSDRCSAYRGATVLSSSVLNLTQPQFIASTSSRPPRQPAQTQYGRAPRTNFVPAPEHAKILTRRNDMSHRSNGPPSRGTATGNYGAAARGLQDQAYAAVPMPPQNALLQQTLIQGVPGIRKDYTAVPPPAILTRGAAPRGVPRVRGSHPPSHRAVSQNNNTQMAAPPHTSGAHTMLPNRGRSRGRGGRGTPLSSATGEVNA